MAAKTGSNYISGTPTDGVEIPSPNSGFSMMRRSIKDVVAVGTVIISVIVPEM